MNPDVTKKVHVEIRRAMRRKASPFQSIEKINLRSQNFLEFKASQISKDLASDTMST